MREIKFRAWDRLNRKMVKIFNIDFKHNVVQVDNGGVTYLGELLSLSDVDLLQYTGLKDNNGMEIFEGDILWNTYDECYGEVTFEEGEWKFEDSTVIQPLYSLLDCIEIKGNIYENNELLE